MGDKVFMQIGGTTSQLSHCIDIDSKHPVRYKNGQCFNCVNMYISLSITDRVQVKGSLSDDKQYFVHIFNGSRACS